MTGDATSRVALVTGGNRGLGLEIVRQLAGQGIKTILTARNQAQAESVAQELKSKGLDVVGYQLDVGQQESVNQLADFVKNQFGRLDILVNNAGISIDGNARASNISMDKVLETLETNVLGAWRMCQAFIPLMRAQRYGRIVNVSSGMGAFTDMPQQGGGWPSYSLSKTALNSLTVMLATELRGTNILVNTVCPGWVRTDMGGSVAPLSVAEGADTPVWLATLPNDGPSGRFFRQRRAIAW